MGLGALTNWWSVYYADHQLVSSIVRYAHLAALLVGGGTALAVDRAVLRSARAGARRAEVVAAMRGSHAVVVPALIIVFTSGVLMTAADWSTFAVSQWFWIKMGTFGLLVLNGAVLLTAERTYGAGDSAGAWRRLVAASGASLLLWLSILWLGEWLTVAA